MNISRQSALPLEFAWDIPSYNEFNDPALKKITLALKLMLNPNSVV
jgi:hypothetical protein